MGRVSDISASLTYNSIEALETAVQPLRDGGWLMDDNKMVSLTANPNNGGLPVIDGATLNIPMDAYNNLGRVAHGTFFNGVREGFYKEFYIAAFSFISLQWRYFEDTQETKLVKDIHLVEYDNLCPGFNFEAFGLGMLDEKERDAVTLDEEDFVEKYPEFEDDYGEFTEYREEIGSKILQHL